jgi:competence protein ComEC
VQRLAFQLSVTAALGLVMVSSRERPGGLFGWLRFAVLSVCAAQLATIAILAQEFSTISLMSIPANVLVAPVASIVFGLALIASVLFPFWNAAGTAVATVGGVGSGYIIAVVDHLGAQESATLRTGDIGLVGQTLLIAISAGGVVALSGECRQSLARWWRQGRENQEAVATVAVAALIGSVVGWVAAGVV